jgi:hypothetical protein
LLDGSPIGPIRFMGGDDYNQRLELIPSSHGDELRRLESAFSQPPPKD